MKRWLLIASALFYVWLCVFFFPMIHDLFHELGHAAYAINSCGAYAAISLGEYAACPNDGSRLLTICVSYMWFLKSLYRTSWTLISESCATKGLSAMGGIFGIVFMWLVMLVVITLIWKFWLRSSWRKSILVGSTYLIVPLKWLRELEIRPKWLKCLLGFGAIILQFDLINEIFYAFFPSRLIIFTYMPYGDGSVLWKLTGYSAETVEKISYAVWAVLLIIYLFIFFLYYRFVMAVKRESGLLGRPVPAMSESNMQLADDIARP